MQRRTCLATLAALGSTAALAPLAAAAQAAAAASAASGPGATPPPPGTDFDGWSEAFAADWMRLSPERATGAGYFTGAEQARLDSRLTPLDAAQQQRQLALAKEGHAGAAAWLASGRLTPSQRVGALTLKWALERQIEAAPFADHSFPFSQTFGLHLRLVNLFENNQPLRAATDIPVWLARLAEVAPRLDEGIARAQSAADRGFLPPRFIVERVQTQVANLLSLPTAQTSFVAALARRSAALPTLDAEARQLALDRASELVTTQVRPAWQRLADFLAALHPRTGDAAGLWRLPQGQAAYAAALVANTTTTLSAEAIHALGLREVARLDAEMDAVLRRMGDTEGSVDARLTALRRRLQPPAEPDPRPMLLERYRQYVADAQRRAQPLFRLQPVAALEVQRVPLLTERTASAYYTTPTPDGARPGVFWVPLPGPNFNIPGMRSLAVHEAVPGHHFQLALQMEQRDLPRWRRQRVFGGGSAHSEGWALYAERLAIDEGWYADDPVSLLGALDSQRFRARRLVVDTGLHAFGWSREQAIAAGISASEVERYVVNPGQACAYMVGMLHLLEVRERARAALGPAFDLRDFHDMVLRTGSVPLDVLSEVVAGWTTGVAAARGGATAPAASVPAAASAPRA